ARRIGVGQLVDNSYGRTPRDHSIDINLCKRRAAIFDSFQGYSFKTINQNFGIDAIMWFNQSEHNVNSLTPEFVRLFQHPISLAHARRGPDINVQPRLALRFEFGEQGFWRSSADHFLHRTTSSSSVCVRQAPDSTREH